MWNNNFHFRECSRWLATFCRHVMDMPHLCMQGNLWDWELHSPSRTMDFTRSHQIHQYRRSPVVQSWLALDFLWIIIKFHPSSKDRAAYMRYLWSSLLEDSRFLLFFPQECENQGFGVNSVCLAGLGQLVSYGRLYVVRCALLIWHYCFYLRFLSHLEFSWWKRKATNIFCKKKESILSSEQPCDVGQMWTTVIQLCARDRPCSRWGDDETMCSVLIQTAGEGSQNQKLLHS